MLRSCLTSLFFLVALSAGYYYWLDHFFEPPGSIIGGGVAGLLVLACLGAIINSRNFWRDWGLLAASRRGLPLVDGRLVAVCGEIHPVGEPLIAPFSKSKCILCEYDLSKQTVLPGDKDDTNTGVDYTGFLMNPCVIRSPQGEVRMLGFPLLEGFSKVHCGSHSAARNALEFLTTTQFEDRTGLKLVTLLNVFSDVWSDEDGLVQKNLRLGKVKLHQLFPPELQDDFIRLEQWEQTGAPPPPAGERVVDEDGEEEEEWDEDEEDDDLDEDVEDDDDTSGPGLTSTIPKMTEQRVHVGDEVCVIGYYNAAQRGLLPPARGRNPNRLFRGTAEALEQKSRGAVWQHLLGGIIGLLVIHGVLYGATLARQNSDDVRRNQQEQAFRAAEQGNIKRLAQLTHRGLDINVRDSEGYTMLMVCGDAEGADWLIQRGADVNSAAKDGTTPLISAASRGRVEIVKQLLAAGADPNYRVPSTGLTSLQAAENAQQHETADLLRQAGAKGE